MKIDTIHTVPKRKLNYWGMLMLIICFFVSCSTLDKGHKAVNSKDVIVTVVPVVQPNGNTLTKDTSKHQASRVPVPVPNSFSLVAPIKFDLQKVSEKMDNSTEALDSLKKLLVLNNRALIEQGKQSKSIQELSQALSRQTRKTDSVMAALITERTHRAQEKRSAEIRETANDSLVTIGRYFPIFAGMLMIGAGAFGYWLRGRQNGSEIQII